MAFKTDVAKNKIILYVVTTEAIMSYDLNGDKLVMMVKSVCACVTVSVSVHPYDHLLAV